MTELGIRPLDSILSDHAHIENQEISIIDESEEGKLTASFKLTVEHYDAVVEGTGKISKMPLPEAIIFKLYIMRAQALYELGRYQEASDAMVTAFGKRIVLKLEGMHSFVEITPSAAVKQYTVKAGGRTGPLLDHESARPLIKALLLRARIEAELNHKKAFRQAIWNARDLYPESGKNIYPYMAGADILSRAGENFEALQLARKAGEIYNKNPEEADTNLTSITILTARVLMESGHALYYRLKRLSRQGDADRFGAIYQESLGHLDEAYKLIDNLLQEEKEKNNAMARTLLSRILYWRYQLKKRGAGCVSSEAEGDYQMAIASIKEACTIEPSNPYPYSFGIRMLHAPARDLLRRMSKCALPTPESPMPTRSGARQRPSAARCGITLRQRYDDVGLPWRNTIGSPVPVSTYASSVSSTRTRRRGWGSAAVIGIGVSLVPRTAGARL